ncbi:MAG: PilZ domain-containing protein [Sphingomonas sp.]|nr:PilZ domain-containing protein [Sphingomonas sp.]
MPLRADVDLRRAGDHRYRVNILDFSPAGCRIELPERVLLQEIIWVSLPGIETLEARVQWVKDWVAGVEFTRPLHPAVFDMVARRMKRDA